MRRKIIFVLSLIVLLFFERYVYSKENVESYKSHKMQEFFKSQYKQEGNFAYTITPLPIEMMILANYTEWEEKRYSYEEKVSKAKELVLFTKDKIIAHLHIKYIGDWLSNGRASIEIPKDIADYIFIENDNGDYIRCSEANIPLMGSSVNIVVKSTSVTLQFPEKIPDKDISIYLNTSKIKFVIGGLDLKDNNIFFKVPFSKWFEDAPPEIKNIYYDAGIWKKDISENTTEENTEAIENNIKELKEEKVKLQNRLREIEQILNGLTKKLEK